MKQSVAIQRPPAVRRHRPEPSASEQRREQLSFWIFIAAIYGILAYHLVPFWLGF